MYVCCSGKQNFILIIISIATKYPMIQHSLDIWYKSKKLKKALGEVDNLDDMHFYNFGICTYVGW